MKEQKARVLVSQPARQYVHQLCLALQHSGRWLALLTSVWYKPHARPFRWLSYLPNTLRHQAEYVLRKRYHPELEEAKIHLFPFFELIRQIGAGMLKARSERWVFYVERLHDRHVARRLKRYHPDILIGYEKACLKSFQVARQEGIITVLDLAQVHFSHIRELRQRFPAFQSLMSDRLFERIRSIKVEEYQYADYVLTLSTYACQTLVEAGFPEERIYTVNLGFDPQRFTAKNQYAVEGQFRILFVGTITKRKGVHLLLEAFSKLAYPDAELVLIGPVLDGQDILDEHRGLYTYYPFMHHEELAQQYREADLFVFPSLLDSWAMTVIEAMASGTPVIVSEHTGAKDAVVQGGGFVVPAGESKVLMEKINYFYRNHAALQQYGQQARKVALRYSWQHYYDQIEYVIKDIYAQERKAKDTDTV